MAKLIQDINRGLAAIHGSQPAAGEAELAGATTSTSSSLTSSSSPLAASQSTSQSAGSAGLSLTQLPMSAPSGLPQTQQVPSQRDMGRTTVSVRVQPQPHAPQAQGQPSAGAAAAAARGGGRETGSVSSLTDVTSSVSFASSDLLASPATSGAGSSASSRPVGRDVGLASQLRQFQQQLLGSATAGGVVHVDEGMAGGALLDEPSLSDISDLHSSASAASFALRRSAAAPPPAHTTGNKTPPKPTGTGNVQSIQHNRNGSGGVGETAGRSGSLPLSARSESSLSSLQLSTASSLAEVLAQVCC